MFDSHCHLNFKAFVTDADEVADSMAADQVYALVVGCDKNSSQAGIELVARHPNLWCSVGLHPTHVLDEIWDNAVYTELAAQDKVVAIGEVGLDFYRLPEESEEKDRAITEQYRVFKAAIALAVKTEKPLVIHSRQAYDEIIEVLSDTFAGDPLANGRLRGTIHCYMGNWQQAQKLLALGFMLGFTGVVTYPDVDPGILETVQNTPLDRILIETDAPYLTPDPYRSEGKAKTGKTPRNLPEYSAAVAELIATQKAKTTREIIEITETNARTLFQLPPPLH